MDAQKFGTFIAVCRKEKNMTQADLAAELQVTDKAVSRWERGIGFPDINTLEPLADALDVSVLELMRSERITEQRYSNEASAEAVSDTLKLARQQQRHERKKIFAVLGIVSIALIIILCLDNMQLQADMIIFTGMGVVFPLFCLCGSAALLGYGIWRKAAGKPAGQTFAFAFGLLLLLIIFFGLFFLAGALGIGPVAN